MISLPEDIPQGTDPRKILQPQQWKMLFSMVFARHGLAIEGLAARWGAEIRRGDPRVDLAVGQAAV